MDRVFVRAPSVGAKIDILQNFATPGDAPRYSRQSAAQPQVMVMDVTDADRVRLEKTGAEIYEDVRFDVLPIEDDEDADDPTHPRPWGGAPAAPDIELCLDDVMEQIGAPDAWRHTRGKGVTIAVVDSGISDRLKEVSVARRSAFDARTAYRGQHWSDDVGHGSMCAAIAAGSREGGGRYQGVAPEATVMAVRTTLFSTDLFDAFDSLVQARDTGQLAGPLVVSNSYGLYTCTPPQVLPRDHPYMLNIEIAIARGIFVCFAAGNNHYKEKCGFDPRQCGPNTIWGPNSHDRVVSVGTVNRALTNCDPSTPHANSSRGPGEWSADFPKPDCVAPTYGEVPWGGSYRKMRWWGTSGACPQVAGLAALILSLAPSLRPDQVAGIIRDTCDPLHEGETCVGRGVINCEAAVLQARALA